LPDIDSYDPKVQTTENFALRAFFSVLNVTGSSPVANVRDATNIITIIIVRQAAITGSIQK